MGPLLRPNEIESEVAEKLIHSLTTYADLAEYLLNGLKTGSDDQSPVHVFLNQVWKVAPVDLKVSEEDHKRAKAEEDARWERFQFSARRPVRSGFRFAYKNYSGTLDTSFSERMHFSSLSKYVALEFYAAAVNLPATVRFEEHFPDIDFPESVSENPLRNSFIPGELKRFFENRAIFTWWDLVQIPLQERIIQIDHPELNNLREKWRGSGLRAISSPYYFSLFEYLDIPIEELEMNRLWVPLKEAREKLSAFTIEIFEQ